MQIISLTYCVVIFLINFLYEKNKKVGKMGMKNKRNWWIKLDMSVKERDIDHVWCGSACEACFEHTLFYKLQTYKCILPVYWCLHAITNYCIFFNFICLFSPSSGINLVTLIFSFFSLLCNFHSFLICLFTLIHEKQKIWLCNMWDFMTIFLQELFRN